VADPLPFWSDNFDMDLLRLFPKLPEALGPVAGGRLWTYGGVTGGRLNHPAVWNANVGLVSLFWTRKPEHARDAGGFVDIEGRLTNASLVECTFLEMIRDAWPHQNALILERHILWKTPRDHFDEILYDLRGWRKSDRVQRLKDEIFDELLRVGRRFDALADRCRVCGCTEFDCSGCIEKTGAPCSWVEVDLCSACVPAGVVVSKPGAAIEVREFPIPPAVQAGINQALGGGPG
jgi:hypothetical protein